MVTDEIDWEELHYVRKQIADLEFRLNDLYNTRKEIIAQMRDIGMKQREIGAYWGISNPRVSGILLQIKDEKDRNSK